MIKCSELEWAPRMCVVRGAYYRFLMMRNTEIQAYACNVHIYACGWRPLYRIPCECFIVSIIIAKSDADRNKNITGYIGLFVWAVCSSFCFATASGSIALPELLTDIRVQVYLWRTRLTGVMHGFLKSILVLHVSLQQQHNLFTDAGVYVSVFSTWSKSILFFKLIMKSAFLWPVCWLFTHIPFN